MTIKYITLEDTVEFPFSLNAPATGGVSDADSAPPFDVRLQGAAVSAAPVYSGTADLLSHANYPAGQYATIVAATAANGFAADSYYSVYVSAAVTTTTGAVVGEFLTTALLDASGIRAALGLATANLDTQLGDVPTVSEMNARTLVAASYALESTATSTNDTIGEWADGTSMPQVDIRKVNSITVTGAGTEPNPWGP